MQSIQSQATNFRIVAINFSVCANKEEFWCLIDAAKPDVIIGSETWLKPDISYSEIFPPGYHVYRKDRADGYGGVLLGISASLNSNKIETEGKFVAAKVLGSKHTIIFAAAYRQSRSDQIYMDTVNQTLSTLCHKFSNMPIWIGDDMNLPDIEWETEQLTTNQYTHSISYSFWDTLANTGLQQIVNSPTINNNTLDAVLTNCPSLAKQCVGMPGLSDHDIIFVKTSSRALRHKPARRKILLWKHANFDNICRKISNWTRDFISSNTIFTPVENLTTIITDSLSKIVSDNVPSMFLTRWLEQCWTTTLTKRMCRRKARAFRKARQTKKSRDWEWYLRLKSATKKTCREAYNNYLIKTLTSDPNGNKRLGALIKSRQHDHPCVAPLKEGNIIYCDPIQQANILNCQFISVFTDDTKTSLPDLGPSQYPNMEDINVSCEGVVKPLKNLKPHKAAGPDDIPLMLLKEAADEIALAITLLFQASINHGNTPSTWGKAIVVPTLLDLDLVSL